MTWYDIKLATMQKMFSADGSIITDDDSTKDYLAGMHIVANECLQMICTTKRPIEKNIEIVNENNTSGFYNKFDLRELASDYMEITGEMYRDTDKFSEFNMQGQTILLLPRSLSGTYTVYYHAWPEELLATTEDTYELQADMDIQTILPLYMASQLCKEDDNGIATSLRNEFEVAYERLWEPKESYKIQDEGGW